MPEEVKTGDTPLTEGVVLFEDTTTPQVPEAKGDTVVQGEVHLLQETEAKPPTAGAMRKLGYVIEDSYADDDVVFSYTADTPVPAGEVNLYREPAQYVGGPPVEDPATTFVRPTDPPTAVPNPTGEEFAARTPEEREAARAQAEMRREAESPSYQAGRNAGARGSERSQNPYDGRSRDGKAWLKGWEEGAASPAPASETPEPREPEGIEPTAPATAPEEVMTADDQPAAEAETAAEAEEAETQPENPSEE